MLHRLPAEQYPYSYILLFIGKYTYKYPYITIISVYFFMSKSIGFRADTSVRPYNVIDRRKPQMLTSHNYCGFITSPIQF